MPDESHENDEALCFFEYVDRHNARNHLCLACCQCEALDQVGDSIAHGQAPTSDMMAELMADVLDRLRLPAFGGARRFKPELIVPNVFIGLVLLMGSLHFILALATPIVLAFGVNLVYRLWVRGLVSGTLFFSAVPSILLWIYTISLILIAPSCSYAVIVGIHFAFLVLAFCIHKTQAVNPGVLPRKYKITSDDGHPVALPLDACDKCGASVNELSRHCR